MSMYIVSDLQKYHKFNWYPDLEHFDEMNPDSTYMEDNQKLQWIVDYLTWVTLSVQTPFEKYLLRHLMSFDMAKWANSKNLIKFDLNKYYKDKSVLDHKYMWDIHRNPEHKQFDIYHRYKYKYMYYEYTSSCSLSLYDLSILYKKDIDEPDIHTYYCLTLFNFFELVQEKLKLHIIPSPLGNGSIVIYYETENGNIYLRSAENDIEFKDDSDYESLVNRLFAICQDL